MQLRIAVDTFLTNTPTVISENHLNTRVSRFLNFLKLSINLSDCSRLHFNK